MTKEEVVDWLKILQHEEHVKADGIVPSCNEIALQMAIDALKQSDKCENCPWYNGK